MQRKRIALASLRVPVRQSLQPPKRYEGRLHILSLDSCLAISSTRNEDDMNTNHETPTSVPELKLACPHCGQHIVVEPEMTGNSAVCPSCNKSFVVPTQQAPFTDDNQHEVEVVSAPVDDMHNGDGTPLSVSDENNPESVRKSAAHFVSDNVKRIKSINGNSINGQTVRDRMTDAIGIEKLQGFSFTELFAQVFAKHSQQDVEKSFTVGTEDSTPSIVEDRKSVV